jgi:glycerol kinase
MEEAGMKAAVLNADGGPTRDDFLMQFQSDIIDLPVECAAIEEVSALGAACAAGLAVGMWSGLDELSRSTGQGGVTNQGWKPVNGRSLFPAGGPRWPGHGGSRNSRRLIRRPPRHSLSVM